MSDTIAMNSVAPACMNRLAQRASDAARILRGNVSTYSQQILDLPPDSSSAAIYGSTPRAQFYRFGLGVLASVFVRAAVNAGDDSTSIPAVSVDYVREQAIANHLVARVNKWEIPIIEHTWTPEAYQVRKLVREFNEATHADY